MSRGYITIRYRLRGDKRLYSFLNQLAGTNRYLWNQCIADLENQYKEHKKTNHTHFDLCKWSKGHKEEVAWLKNYPQVLTRTSLQDLAHAYKSFLLGKKRLS